MNKKIAVIVFFAIIMSWAKAQVNFVLNYSFEEMGASCLNYQNGIWRTLWWDTLRNGGGGTPDLFNECCTDHPFVAFLQTG